MNVLNILSLRVLETRKHGSKPDRGWGVGVIDQSLTLVQNPQDLCGGKER